MIPQYIKSPYTAEQLRASGSRISSNNHANGTWRINGKNAMDKHGRIYLSFIKSANHRRMNYLRGLLARRHTGFEKLNRPFRTDKAQAFNPDCGDDAFSSLALKGEVWALKRLISLTDRVGATRKARLIKKAEQVKRAIDAKADYGNRNQAAASATDTLSELAKKTKPTGEKCQTRHAKPAETKTWADVNEGNCLVTGRPINRDLLPEGGAQAQDADGHNRAVGNANAEPPPAPAPKRSWMERAGKWLSGLIRK